jgi:hypothetical protein
VLVTNVRVIRPSFVHVGKALGAILSLELHRRRRRELRLLLS